MTRGTQYPGWKAAHATRVEMSLICTANLELDPGRSHMEVRQGVYELTVDVSCSAGTTPHTS